LTLRVVLRCILYQGIIGITTAAAVKAEATEQLQLLTAVAESLHVVEVQVRRPPAIIKEIEALPAVCARLRTARVARERAIAKQRHHVNLLTTVFNSRVVYTPKTAKKGNFEQDIFGMLWSCSCGFVPFVDYVRNLGLVALKKLLLYVLARYKLVHGIWSLKCYKMGEVQNKNLPSPKTCHWPRFGPHTASPLFFGLASAKPVINSNSQDCRGVTGVSLHFPSWKLMGINEQVQRWRLPHLRVLLYRQSGGRTSNTGVLSTANAS
jgi:hypothetical protein